MSEGAARQQVASMAELFSEQQTCDADPMLQEILQAHAHIAGIRQHLGSVFQEAICYAIGKPQADEVVPEGAATSTHRKWVAEMFNEPLMLDLVKEVLCVPPDSLNNLLARIEQRNTTCPVIKH